MTYCTVGTLVASALSERSSKTVMSSLRLLDLQLYDIISQRILYPSLRSELGPSHTFLHKICTNAACFHLRTCVDAILYLPETIGRTDLNLEVGVMASSEMKKKGAARSTFSVHSMTDGGCVESVSYSRDSNLIIVSG